MGKGLILYGFATPTRTTKTRPFVVTKISHEQSRRNAARRRRRVAGRHALAGHWGQREAPMFGSGPVAYEIGGNIDATCFGGAGAVHRLVSKLGLVGRSTTSVRLT